MGGVGNWCNRRYFSSSREALVISPIELFSVLPLAISRGPKYNSNLFEYKGFDFFLARGEREAG